MPGVRWGTETGASVRGKDVRETRNEDIRRQQATPSKVVWV